MIIDRNRLLPGTEGALAEFGWRDGGPQRGLDLSNPCARELNRGMQNIGASRRRAALNGKNWWNVGASGRRVGLGMCGEDQLTGALVKRNLPPSSIGCFSPWLATPMPCQLLTMFGTTGWSSNCSSLLLMLQIKRGFIERTGTSAA